MTRTEQRFTFNSVAEQYDAARPGYPPAAFEALQDFAGLASADPVLEVGCGTGIATEGLARLGLVVTALDPGEDMIAVARRRLAAWPGVGFILGRFEEVAVEPGGYAGVVSAQAFHWVPPEIGYPKAARALRPGGVFAIMGHVLGDPSAELMAAFEPHYQRHAPQLWGVATDTSWYLPGGPVASAMAATGAFGQAEHRCWTWPEHQTGADFVARLGTISAYLMLDLEERAALFDALCSVVDASGGVDFQHQTHLYMARKRSEAA